ncbi:MAG: TetR/AcrR family transcriptional regulator [Acidothermaceae bacterium]
MTTDHIVVAAAQLCDEIGFHELTMGVLAERIGVRPPSLYKHLESLADLQHRIATLAMAELGDRIREAMQGKAELDALSALLNATRGYVTEHPGRYTATIGAVFSGHDDPLYVASARVLDSIAAVLRGYGIGPDEADHAIRMMRCTLHGFAVLVAVNGFQWDADLDESFRWMLHFIDTGLRALH